MTDKWYIATVRHGETDYNKQKRYAGCSVDASLSEAGKKDAGEAAPIIGSMKFEIALTSPSQRTIETARILTEGKTEIIISPHARDRDYGILEGRLFSEVEHIRPPIHFIKVGGDYHSLDPPHAETFENVRARAETFHADLLSRFRGKRILVVSHLAFLQQLHGFLRGLDWIDSLGISVDNIEMTTFHYEGDQMVSEKRTPLCRREHEYF